MKINPLYIIDEHVGHISHLLPIFSKLGGTLSIQGYERIQKAVKNYVNIPMQDYYQLQPKNYNLFLACDYNTLKNVQIPDGAKKVWVPHGLGAKGYQFNKTLVDFFDLYLSSSLYEYKMLKDSGVNMNKVALVGYPKFNISIYKKYLNQPEPPKKDYIFYCPTWGGDSSLSRSYKKVKDELKKGEFILVKAHPQLGHKHWNDKNSKFYEGIENLSREYKNLLLLDKNVISTIPYIKGAKVVWADRSACAFEAISLGKKFVNMTPNDEIFLERLTLYRKYGSVNSNIATDLAVKAIKDLISAN